MIRLARDDEAAATYAVYADAVLNGTAPHYSTEQAQAWVPTSTMEEWWPSRIDSGTTWVAEKGGRIVGVLTYLDGHLDLFFVRPEVRGTGTAAQLYDRMIKAARAEGRSRLTTFASHLARTFLERRGWTVLDQEVALRNGVPLTRFRMELTLSY